MLGIDRARGRKFFFPHDLAGQPLDRDTRIRFVREILRRLLVFVVGFYRCGNAVAGEEFRGNADPRSVDGEEAELSRAPGPLVSGEIREVESGRDLLERNLLRKRRGQGERLPRRQAVFEDEAIVHAEREIAFQRDAHFLDGNFELRHRGREREPFRELFRRHLLGQRLVQLEEETASIGAVAFR